MNVVESARSQNLLTSLLRKKRYLKKCPATGIVLAAEIYSSPGTCPVGDVGPSGPTWSRLPVSRMPNLAIGSAEHVRTCSSQETPCAASAMRHVLLRQDSLVVAAPWGAHKNWKRSLVIGGVRHAGTSSSPGILHAVCAEHISLLPLSSHPVPLLALQKLRCRRWGL